MVSLPHASASQSGKVTAIGKAHRSLTESKLRLFRLYIRAHPSLAGLKFSFAKKIEIKLKWEMSPSYLKYKLMAICKRNKIEFFILKRTMLPSREGYEQRSAYDVIRRPIGYQEGNCATSCHDQTSSDCLSCSLCYRCPHTLRWETSSSIGNDIFQKLKYLQVEGLLNRETLRKIILQLKLQ